MDKKIIIFFGIMILLFLGIVFFLNMEQNSTSKSFKNIGDSATEYTKGIENAQSIRQY